MGHFCATACRRGIILALCSMTSRPPRALGNNLAVQMRGHGCVVVGETAEQTLFACTFLEENAGIQLQAEIFGGAIPLTPDEARDCAEGTFHPRLFPLLWTYYERKVRLDA